VGRCLRSTHYTFSGSIDTPIPVRVMEASPRSQASTNHPTQSGSSLSVRHAVNRNISLGCQQRAGPSTQLNEPEEALHPGRKRSSTHVIHGQYLVKRSRENLRDEELQASKTQVQTPRIEQQTDSEEGPNEVDTLKSLLREFRANQDYKTLERRRNYVKKSINCSVEGGMSPTVKDGLATLPKLDSKVFGARVEGELGSLDSIPVETAEERVKRVNDWVRAARTGKYCKSLPQTAATDLLHRLYTRRELF